MRVFTGFLINPISYPINRRSTPEAPQIASESLNNALLLAEEQALSKSRSASGQRRELRVYCRAACSP